MQAGSPFIARRTFAAKDHPKGSPERERLNEDPVTSDRKSDFPWVLQRRGADPEYFGRYELAENRMVSLIIPFMPSPVEQVFNNMAPPVPSNPEEVIQTGEFAGKTVGEAHAEHFDPSVSDREFATNRAAALGVEEVNPDWSVGEREQQSRDKPLADAIAAEAKARGINIPPGVMIVSHVK